MKRCLYFALAALFLTSAGCQSTYRSEDVKTSGFLSDYSQLKPEIKGRASMFYFNKDSHFSAYTNILLEPIGIYVGKDHALQKLPPEEAQALVNYLDASLRGQLTNDYSLVTTPGPSVMRLRVAITEAKSSPVMRDLLSSVVPFSVALSTLKRVTIGSHLAVGSAGIESEAFDSVTGERLFAVVDVQIGRKVTGKVDKFEAWHAVQDACDYWALRFRDGLSEARQRSP